MNRIYNEVQMPRFGAPKELGDVDVLLFDQKKKIVYSIECKRTPAARNIHAMKTEMDRYLGRDGKPGMIQKHVDRHTWLSANKSAVAFFFNVSDTDIHVVSIVLTSSVLPLRYLKSDLLPLPIVFFTELSRKGLAALEVEVDQ